MEVMREPILVMPSRRNWTPAIPPTSSVVAAERVTAEPEMVDNAAGAIIETDRGSFSKIILFKPCTVTLKSLTSVIPEADEESIWGCWLWV